MFTWWILRITIYVFFCTFQKTARGMSNGNGHHHKGHHEAKRDEKTPLLGNRHNSTTTEYESMFSQTDQEAASVVFRRTKDCYAFKVKGSDYDSNDIRHHIN